MLWTKFKRVIRGGFISFWRNGFVSLTAVLVMTLSLSVFAGLVFFNVLSSAYIESIRDKVDVNVYFTLDATEASILGLETALEALPEVERVDYVSRDAALIAFREENKDNALIIQGLDELGSNPLPASLNIKAREPSQYGSVVAFLESNAVDATLIESVNYNKNKIVIDKLVELTHTVEQIGLMITIILVLLAILITFNTIRLSIYSAREEISVMKLVGAGNMHVRGPFIISGMMYGIVAAIVTIIIFYPITYYLGELLAPFGGSLNVVAFYAQNFALMFFAVMGAGIILGAVSSFLAVRRYLRV